MTSIAETLPGERACTTCGGLVAAGGLTVCNAHIADELGITFRQLDFWERRGYLRSQARNYQGGSGFPRSWPAEELEIARRMGRLTATGIPPSLAASFARDSWPRGEIAPGVVIEVTP